VDQYIGNEITYLLPGELIVTDSPMKISTVLGSCVAVCLYDHEKRIGGMNHFMLPDNKNNDILRWKYGNTSLADMLSKMLTLGARKEKILARIYGGSAILFERTSVLNMGNLNIEAALRFLKENNITLNSAETGGNRGRKVVFDTWAGVISCNYLSRSKE
jgi:chemotaxis protein CheD